MCDHKKRSWSKKWNDKLFKDVLWYTFLLNALVCLRTWLKPTSERVEKSPVSVPALIQKYMNNVCVSKNPGYWTVIRSGLTPRPNPNRGIRTAKRAHSQCQNISHDPMNTRHMQQHTQALTDNITAPLTSVESHLSSGWTGTEPGCQQMSTNRTLKKVCTDTHIFKPSLNQGVSCHSSDNKVVISCLNDYRPRGSHPCHDGIPQGAGKGHCLKTPLAVNQFQLAYPPKCFWEDVIISALRMTREHL